MAIKRIAEMKYPRTCNIMLYGQAGMGKSTLALSSPTPLYIDFDGSGKRLDKSVIGEIATLDVSTWDEVMAQVTDGAADLAPYGTIVVDTVGKMVDWVIAKVCSYRTRDGRTAMRQPQIQDWGKINQECINFIRAVNALHKNVIFVAQRDTRSEKTANGEDVIKYVPNLRDKVLQAILPDLDLLAFVEMMDERGVKKRTITFDPTERNEGKNTCGMPSVANIPEVKVASDNNFIIKNVLEPYARRKDAEEEAEARYQALISDIKGKIEAIEDVDGLNDFVAHIDDFQHIGSSKLKAGVMLKARAKALNAVLNKETKVYEAA